MTPPTPLVASPKGKAELDSTNARKWRIKLPVVFRTYFEKSIAIKQIYFVFWRFPNLRGLLIHFGAKREEEGEGEKDAAGKGCSTTRKRRTRKKRSGEEEEEKMHACRSVAVEQRGAKGEREREKD